MDAPLIAALAAMPRVRIERRLARRIDKLARRAHAFHRFAHHPLCDRYAGELIALRGRTRVCRGCGAALLGTSAGIGLGTALSGPPLGAAVVTALALGVWVVAQVQDRKRSRDASVRLAKSWTRALPMAAAGYAISSTFRASVAWGCAWTLVFAISVSVLVAAYRRRGPDRTQCRACPERTGAVPCSGFRDIVRAERAFVRRSRQLLDRAATRG